VTAAQSFLRPRTISRTLHRSVGLVVLLAMMVAAAAAVISKDLDRLPNEQPRAWVMRKLNFALAWVDLSPRVGTGFPDLGAERVLRLDPTLDTPLGRAGARYLAVHGRDLGERLDASTRLARLRGTDVHELRAVIGSILDGSDDALLDSAANAAAGVPARYRPGLAAKFGADAVVDKWGERAVDDGLKISRIAPLRAAKADFLNERGVQLFNERDFAGAVDQFVAAHTLNPDDDTIATNLEYAREWCECRCPD
jgi:hypothetical protein